MQFSSKTFTDFIPNYKKENNEQTNEKNEKSKEDNNYNELEKKLNEEIMKNKRLEEENKKLKDELEKLKDENEKLKSDLLSSNKIISGIQNKQMDNDELKKLKDENTILKSQLNIKDNEIQDLKLKIQNNSIELPKYNPKEIIVVTFISQDSTIKEGVKCLPTDLFAEVEEKLYKKYDNLRNTNNTFTANAKPVLRFKKICENGIKDGDKIQLLKLE